MDGVLAAAEFDRECHHTSIRQQFGARSIIPTKRGQKTWPIHGVRAEMRRAFPRRQYSQRALVETVVSTVKRKLSAPAPGRSRRLILLREALPSLESEREVILLWLEQHKTLDFIMAIRSWPKSPSGESDLLAIGF